jgi:two-component system sensor histidine kinase BaeS
MRSLGVKLVLAFLVVSLIGTAVTVILATQATTNEFGHFVFRQDRQSFVNQFGAYYAQRSSWLGVDHMNPGRGPGSMMGNEPMPGGPEAFLAVADSAGVIVRPGAGYVSGQQVPDPALKAGIPIQVNGEQVGTLLEGRQPFAALPTAGQDFLRRVNLALVVATLSATGLALILGILLTRALTRPVRELTEATRAVAAGQLGLQVEVRSKDELGQLAASFNQMSTDLARARNLRRQLTADVAHELRTPLTLILGHAEALSEGVLPANAENLRLVHEEAQRLSRMVEDLRLLSRAEAGELPLTLGPVEPEPLARDVVAKYSPAAAHSRLTLELQADSRLPTIRADADRLNQVLDNLLDNAIRHTPANGTITVRLTSSADKVRFEVRDTGPGISPEDLPRVFERFYRADAARSRDTGGSGLGLAIARSIVEAHGGHIGVESQAGEGARFWFDLPKDGGHPLPSA